MNIPRFAAIVARIEANPKCWDQAVWHSDCGTAHCLFGHAQNGKSRLTVNCLSGGNVQWIVIISKLTGIKSAAGICQPQDLRAALALYGPERWFGG